MKSSFNVAIQGENASQVSTVYQPQIQPGIIPI